MVGTPSAETLTDRAGQSSIRINQQWRICNEWHCRRYIEGGRL
jgi:plasmid maintenance system killer protein